MAGAIAAGSLVRGATNAVQAGKRWRDGTAIAAELAGMAYVPLVKAGLAANVTTVAVISVDLL